MCNIWKKSPAPELSPADVDAFFRKSDKFSWVGITGGEPFLREELPQIIDIILKRSRRLCAIHFATNGTLTEKIIGLASKTISRNKRIKLLFTVSIDGPAPLHDKIRGIDGTWRKALATFGGLKNIERVRPRFGFTLSDSNMGKFKETFSSLKDAYPDLTSDDLTVNVFQKSSFYYENQSLPGMDTQKLLAELKDILAIDKNKISFNNFLRRSYLELYSDYLKAKKCPLKCTALSSSCYIDPYGNLYPCGVYNKHLINIKDFSGRFEALWNSSRAKRLSWECSNNKCPSCWSPCDAYSTMLGSLIPLLIKKV